MPTLTDEQMAEIGWKRVEAADCMADQLVGFRRQLMRKPDDAELVELVGLLEVHEAEHGHKSLAPLLHARISDVS